MNKKKILSLIMALVMLVGVFSPLTALAAEADGETETLTVHKILMTKEGLKNHDVNKKGYDGNKIENIKTFFESSAKEIDGVYFKLQKLKTNVEKDKVDVNNDDQWEDVAGQAGLTGSQKDKTNNKLEGYTFNTKGLKGQFRIVEVHDKSTYKGEKGETLTDKKAVPSLVTLPLINDNGVVTNAHMYPKNTEDKPKIDKNFDNEKNGDAAAITTGDLTDSTKDVEVKPGYNEADKDQREKGTAKKQLGDKVPYKVVTEIPAQTKWATAKWHDEMTEGLTYNKDLSIELKKGTETVTLTNDTDYKIKDGNNGFILEFTKAGLDKLNNKAETQTITLKYTATLNNKAVADVEESNDITFHYGNKPGHGNTPIPNKPKNGEMEFTKSWDGEAPANASVTVQLYNANTGKAVGEAKTLNAGNSWKATWTGLDNDTEYKVVETAVAGYEAEYSKGDGLGKLGVKNWKSDNPTPLNPSEPKVVNGGKKFVKTNEKEGKELERLAGAEFYVINNIEGDANKGKYLVTKEKTTTNIATAKKALEDAVKAYNGLTAEEQKGQKGTEAKNLIDQKQEAYNKAIKENASDYEWGEKTDANVVVLTSDTEGRFEITGLAYGSYKLEEKTPPAGFAKLSGDVDFTVGKGSYDGKNAEGNGPADKHIQYNKANTDKNYGQRVVNKKVSIPQTGGMGTVLFTVVGISLMAGAVIAMKKNREEA
ncbi:LPXTG-motif cell wall anchor domain protein [Peptoniphilus harei ACS-146-V-Sch2b]|uniref:LPXTG-motif cell wall anchor domain protein n=1 Tax=Peptoniphilus harei ACS-146-V-Sch2b TaxID=908338 RepID=E4L030_9FIRM|nr:pilin N-terminal domain-containing protein [Peptoniphilus harei]EFR32596.1 LPXTG-motif cell wall anchor domain protein [Peptoniphilus harei ACS-146-V-Sch2b]